MTRTTTILTASLILAVAAGPALGDGMIVPVRPDLRVRGDWAVKYHHVEIKVRDQVAFTHIDQQFVNTGSGMIEVEYLFPVPPGAAIDSMTLVVNGKEFAAKLLKADEARRIYEDIVRRKKDPALLEYVGYGLYKTSAFPLEPGKPARVVVTYKNVCHKDSGLVEVWYPLNTEKFSAKAIEDVQVRVDIEADSDITTVYSPSHDIKKDQKDPRHVVAEYSVKNALPVTDFQLYYKTSDKGVGATVLTYQPYGEKDGYFLLLVSPNPREGEKHVVPKDIVLALDRSGSMGGKKLQQAVDALRQVLKNLNAEDRFNVIVYDDSVETFFDSLHPVTQENIDEALAIADRIEAKGATDIGSALAKAFEQLANAKLADDARPRYVIFLTDGQPTSGLGKDGNLKELLSAAKEKNTVAARLFAFGVGYDVNVRLLDALAEQHHGRSDYVRPEEPVEAKVAALYNKIRNPVMTNLAVEVQSVRLKDMYPRELGDLFDGDQIVLAGRYDARELQAAGRGDANRQCHTQLIVRGVYGGKEKAFEYPVTFQAVGKSMRLEFVEKLWAIRRVGWLLDQIQQSGENREIKDELIRLSKEYGIMTPYTSFLADDRTDLAAGVRLREQLKAATGALRTEDVGGQAQMDAVNRQLAREMKSAAEAGPAPASTPGVMPAGRGGNGLPDAVTVLGNSQVKRYEAGEKEVVSGVRQVGNQALYQRGRTWIASNASDVDVDKDAAKIQALERFSDKYFELVKTNSAEENRLLASQRDGETLIVTLQGLVYRVE